MSLQPLLEASPVIQIHAFAAIAAFVIGAYVLFNKKGDARHKLLGRIWVVLMVVVAITSFFIWTIRLLGPFSPIHILSLVTFVSLFRAIGFARAGKIMAHQSAMQSLYMGALVIAGFFTFMPGRIMHEVLFGTDATTPLQWALFITVFVGSFALGALIVRRRTRRQFPHMTKSAA